VHQFVPALIPRDATGSHTLLLREVLRGAGWRSEIFAEATHDELLGESLPIGAYPDAARPGDVLLYQFSTSSMVADFLAEREEPLILDYHNITEAEHAETWDPEGAARSAAARTQLARLAPRCALGIADSEFNRHDLVSAGCRRSVVVPVLVDLDRLASAPDPAVAGRLASVRASGGSDWLFVGRLVPSKAQHELVKALWAHRRLHGEARLHLVGTAPAPRYATALRNYVAELGIADAVEFAGEVTDAALAAYFAAADVYVSLSVHEGFGVPLVEAMRTGVPVVALDRGAVGDTVGPAGLLLDNDEPSLVAEAVARVLGDTDLRDRLVAGGRRRAAALGAGRARRFVDAVAGVAGPPPVPVVAS
jgi:glycosyltransferase involved in cell wall biosynthesis